MMWLTLAICLQVDQSKVDAAVERGEKYLLEASKALPKVTWNSDPDGGYDELVLYTLVHAGTSPTEESFQKLLKTALTAPLKRTYRAALTAMALQAIDPKKYYERIAECAQFLVDNQCSNGQWTYGFETTYPFKKEKSKDVETGSSSGSGGSKPSDTRAAKKITVKQQKNAGPWGDNSNTQYAALGLRACLEAGVEIEPKVLELAASWWEKSQLSDGAWSYSSGNAKDPKGCGSMTAGGLASYVIMKHWLKQDVKDSKIVKGALDWIAKNWSVSSNPQAPESPDRWVYYYLYALERVGIILKVEKIGDHKWYAEGATWLLAEQSGAAWDGPDPNRDSVISDTCFAILFLRRATKPLPKVATGK